MKHTRQDLKIMQGWSLERKIRVTQTRIMEWYMRYDGQVFISFSGGKDSTVLLDLARRVYPDIPAVYVDTGLVKAPVYEQPATQREKAPEPDEIIPYRWNARNIRIAVAGSQRRSGVTVTAFNLASWLAARGAEVAYIEVNQNRHLQLLLNIYEAAPDGEHYTIDGIDCYLTNEPDKAYQFIIYDCGVMQTPTSIFRDADHRLLCGSVLPYEIPVFHKALSECGSLEVRPVAICVPQEIQEYCMELFGENVQIAAASHDLFAKRVNGQIYRPLVEKYIAGEKRL